MIWFTSDLHLNHKAVLRMNERYFGTVWDMNRAFIDNINERVEKDDTLCPFPIMSWYKSRHGSYHFHGHIHSLGSTYNWKMVTERIRRYDVGVDANEYKPVSLEEILAFMKLGENDEKKD